MSKTENSDLYYKRIIGFDVLRTIMLFGLFIFHCGVSFMETTVDPEVWRYKNESTSIIFDGLLGFVHAFRHPTFFIISGFVTEMMYRKYTSSEVIKKRFKRLFLPFLITTIIAGPLIYGLLARIYGLDHPFSFDNMFPPNAHFKHSFGTTFVWFLYYLIIFNIIHFVYHQFVKNFPEKIQTSSVLKFFGQMFVLFVLESLVLYWWNQNSLFGLYSFLPNLGSLGGYFLFYIVGIMLYRNLGDLDRLRSYSWMLTTIGILSLTCYFILGTRIMEHGGNTFNFNWAVMLSSNAAAIFLSFGALGLAMRYYTQPKKTVSYISKSSYFLYLIHFPFTLIFLDIFIDFQWNAIAKFSVVFSLTVLSAFLLNHLWIKAWKENPPI